MAENPWPESEDVDLTPELVSAEHKVEVQALFEQAALPSAKKIIEIGRGDYRGTAAMAQVELSAARYVVERTIGMIPRSDGGELDGPWEKLAKELHGGGRESRDDGKGSE